MAAHPDYAEAYNSLGVGSRAAGAARRRAGCVPEGAGARSDLGEGVREPRRRRDSAGDLNGAAADLAQGAGARSAPGERAQRARCGATAPGARGGGDCRVEDRAASSNPRTVRRALQPRHGAHESRPPRRGAALPGALHPRSAAQPLRHGHPATAGPARRMSAIRHRRSAALQGCRGRVTHEVTEHTKNTRRILVLRSSSWPSCSS